MTLEIAEAILPLLMYAMLLFALTSSVKKVVLDASRRLTGRDPLILFALTWGATALMIVALVSVTLLSNLITSREFRSAFRLFVFVGVAWPWRTWMAFETERRRMFPPADLSFRPYPIWLQDIILWSFVFGMLMLLSRNLYAPTAEPITNTGLILFVHLINFVQVMDIFRLCPGMRQPRLRAIALTLFLLLTPIAFVTVLAWSFWRSTITPKAKTSRR